MYRAQILTGLGIGAVMGITLLMPPLVVEKRDTGKQDPAPPSSTGRNTANV